MFEANTWEFDASSKELSKELCQAYRLPKQNKKNKSKIEVNLPQPLCTAATNIEKSESYIKPLENKTKGNKLNKKSERSTPKHNATPKHNVSCEKKKVTKNNKKVKKNFDPTEVSTNIKPCNFKFADNSQTKRSSKKNKYKNTEKPIKTVGTDRRGVGGVLDIPKVMKFSGEKLSNFTVDSVANQLKETNVRIRVKKSRKSRFKNKFDKNVSTKEVIVEDRSTNDNITPHNIKLTEKLKTKRKKKLSQDDNKLNNLSKVEIDHNAQKIKDNKNSNKKQKNIKAQSLKTAFINPLLTKNFDENIELEKTNTSNSIATRNDQPNKISSKKKKNVFHIEKNHLSQVGVEHKDTVSDINSVKEKKLLKDKKRKRRLEEKTEANIDSKKIKREETTPLLKHVQDKTGMSPPVKKHLEANSHVKSPFNISKLKILLAENNSKSKKHEENDSQVDHKFDLETVKKSNDNISEQDDTNLLKKKESQSLKEKLKEKLDSARFRYLNEQFYTKTGSEAFKLFKYDPKAFQCYHTGFQAQVHKWPLNPVDKIISYIKTKPSSLVIADFGCGEAKIAQTVKNTVYSFDLLAVNKHVTPCNITNVPLDNCSIDIAVFCLSLMGTNFIKYLCEANRVLKHGGRMLIAEVSSRFESMRKFKRRVEQLGFSSEYDEDSNKMFLWFEFKKTGKHPAEDKLPNIVLEPCLYKRR